MRNPSAAVDKGEVFERVMVMPRLLDGMAHVLGPRFKLSSMNARVAGPHSDSLQPRTRTAAPAAF